VSAILIEDLGKCFDFSARRGSESPNRNSIVGGCRAGIRVPTHALSTTTVSLGGSDLARARDADHPVIAEVVRGAFVGHPDPRFGFEQASALGLAGRNGA
jgi:hypothetical protein